MEGPEIKFFCELRKRKEKPILELNENDLKNNPDKVLTILRKESINLRLWFYVIVNIK
jgi:hypothetical protein